jgi:PhnB protein
VASREGYHTITPYLVCRDAVAAIDYYRKHFGAREKYRLAMPDGSLAHAEIEIGDSVVMIAEENVAMGITSPQHLGGTGVTLNIYVEDPDSVSAAIASDGGTILFAVADQFHGDRSGKVADRFGHVWHIATNQEQVADAEIVARFGKMMG